MGEGSQRITANGDSENNGLSSCEAHHVTRCPQEGRSGTAGAVGEGEGAAEKGCLAEIGKLETRNLVALHQRWEAQKNNGRNSKWH
jgi:hypothetical protein